MLAEIKKEKILSKKVCSETSFQRESEIKKSEKQQIGFLPVLKLSDKKLSKSLNDLSRQTGYELCSSRRNDSFLSPERDKYGNYSVLSTDGFCNNNKEARCILNLLMLNAWRRQKVGYKAAQEKIETLTKKVEGFEMQVYVLRQLLNAEKKRVETANDNIHELLQKVEECNKEKSLIVKENDKNFSKLLEYCSQIENALKNQENDIITSRLEAKNWENQLEKEREKLKKMEREEIFIKGKYQRDNKKAMGKYIGRMRGEKTRKELKKMTNELRTAGRVFATVNIPLRRNEYKKCILVTSTFANSNRIQANEQLLLLKTQQIEQLTQANRELQTKLDVQVPLWDEAMAQVDLANAKLKESEEIKVELEKALEKKEKEIKELKSTIASLEERLREEDEKNGLLGKSIVEKSNELNLIQKKLLELSKSSYPWSGGIIKVASFCAKIPVACICTVGSLLLPFPSYRL